MSFRSVDPFKLDENFIQAIGKEYMLITAAKPDGSINSMTAAWGSVGYIWHQPAVFCFIRPQRCTKAFVEASSTFSLSFFDSTYSDMFAFMGSVSGYADDKKVAHSGLTVAYKEILVAQTPPLGEKPIEQTPYFSEARLVILCERLYQQDMLGDCFLDKSQLSKWYGKAGGANDLHTMYIAAIKDVLIRE